jgi:hypothetical protein
MGLITPINVYNSQREIFTQLGVNPDLYVSPPPPPSPPPMPNIKLAMDDLTPVEAIQVKQRMGIQPDVPGNIEMGIREHQEHTMNIAKTHSGIVKDREEVRKARIDNRVARENISEPTPRATTK